MSEGTETNPLKEEGAKRLRKQFIWIVISVMFAAFMSKLDVYIVNISLPTIAKYFNTTASVVSRTVIVYLLAGTSTLLFFGKLGDRYGQKRIFVLGYGLFTLGSMLCGLSPHINLLVCSRFIQGIGGAMLISAAYAIVPKFVPKEINGWAFGILSTGAALGIAVGAPVGGLINRYLTWHWVFLVNVPVGIIAIAVARKVIPSEGTAVEGHYGLKGFDIPGTVLSFMGLSLLLYAINIGHSAGWTSLIVLSLFAASFVLLAAFFEWEKMTAHPLFDFDIYRDSRFLFTNISAFFGIALLGGSSFLMPFYLQLFKGMNPFSAGLVLMSYSVIYIFVSPFTGRASDRIQPSILCFTGMISAAAAALVFAMTLTLKGVAPAVGYLVWFGLSFAFFFSPNNSFVMSLPSPEKKGVASGSYNAVVTIGTALGVAIFETVFSMALPPHQGSIASNIAADPSFRFGLTHAFSCAFVAGTMMGSLSSLFSWLNIHIKHVPLEHKAIGRLFHLHG